MSEQTILQALQTLEQAKQAYDAAQADERDASRRETAALNDLNRAQAAFDAAVAAVKKDASGRSDWAQNRRAASALVAS